MLYVDNCNGKYGSLIEVSGFHKVDQTGDDEMMFSQVRETVTMTTSVLAFWNAGPTTASPSQAASGTKAEFSTDQIRDSNKHFAITHRDTLTWWVLDIADARDQPLWCLMSHNDYSFICDAESG